MIKIESSWYQHTKEEDNILQEMVRIGTKMENELTYLKGENITEKSFSHIQLIESNIFLLEKLKAFIQKKILEADPY